MELKFAQGRLRIHLLLIPVCGLLWYLNGAASFFAFAGALLLHELFHLFMASALGVRVVSLELLPFGCAANMGGMEYAAKGKEVMIAAAGPAASLITAAACRAMGLDHTTIGRLFQRSNLALGAMNLMPVFPLDGGRIAMVMLGMFLPRNTAKCIASILGAVLGMGICVMGFLSVGNPFSFLVMGSFMIFSSLKKMRADEFDMMAVSAIKRRTLSRKQTMDVKNIVCRGEKTLGEVYVALDQRKYNLIYVIDREMCVQGVIDEGVLMKRMLKEGSTALISGTKKESEQRLLRFPK